MVGAVSSALASASAVRLRAMLTNMPPCVLAADICVLFMGEGVVVYACCRVPSLSVVDGGGCVFACCCACVLLYCI